MTIYTEDLCNGGIASSNGAWQTWVAANAFDNNLNTGFHHVGFPAILQYQMLATKQIEKYTIQITDRTYQAPKNFSFEGSNNNIDWISLNIQENLTWVDGEKKEFTFDNSNNYLYYRLFITSAVQTGSNPTVIEVEMMEKKYPKPVSNIYDISHRGNIRGKAKQGLIRPTIKQFFMSSPDWEEKFRGYKAKSVIFDINSRYGGDNYGIRKVEFFDNNTLHTLNNNYEAYHSSTFNINYYQATFVFNSNLTKLGSAFYNSWASVKTGSPQRLIVVFDNELTFNKIIVNNYHNVGDLNSLGLKNVKITITDEVITNTTPNTSIQNGIVIFDDIFEQHTAVNEVQDWEVPLVSPSV